MDGLTVGTDLVEVARVGRLLGSGERFVSHWFTSAEAAYCLAKAHPERHLAGRLAAKEAVVKALRLPVGTVRRTAIEVVHDDAGAPRVLLHAEVAEAARAARRAVWSVSLAHEEHWATAVALAVTVPRHPLAL